jgi:hypothetical protein
MIRFNSNRSPFKRMTNEVHKRFLSVFLKPLTYVFHKEGHKYSFLFYFERNHSVSSLYEYSLTIHIRLEQAAVRHIYVYNVLLLVLYVLRQ